MDRLQNFISEGIEREPSTTQSSPNFFTIFTKNVRSKPSSWRIQTELDSSPLWTFRTLCWVSRSIYWQPKLRTIWFRSVNFVLCPVVTFVQCLNLFLGNRRTQSRVPLLHGFLLPSQQHGTHQTSLPQRCQWEPSRTDHEGWAAALSSDNVADYTARDRHSLSVNWSNPSDWVSNRLQSCFSWNSIVFINEIFRCSDVFITWLIKPTKVGGTKHCKTRGKLGSPNHFDVHLLLIFNYRNFLVLLSH